VPLRQYLHHGLLRPEPLINAIRPPPAARSQARAGGSGLSARIKGSGELS
jgi:hypothetical protein